MILRSGGRIADENATVGPSRSGAWVTVKGGEEEGEEGSSQGSETSRRVNRGSTNIRRDSVNVRSHIFLLRLLFDASDS